MSPVTALPYAMVLKAEVVVQGGIQTLKDERDTDYLAHAANAYPKLVAAIQSITARARNPRATLTLNTTNLEELRSLLSELGEDA